MAAGIAVDDSARHRGVACQMPLKPATGPTGTGKAVVGEKGDERRLCRLDAAIARRADQQALLEFEGGNVEPRLA